MADHVSPIIVCNNSESSEQVSQDKVKTRDLPEQDKETKSLQVICGNSEAQVREPVKTKKTEEIHMINVKNQKL